MAPDEIFLDSANLPEFDTSRLEGSIERPIERRRIIFFASLFLLVGALLFTKVTILQAVEGGTWSAQAEENRLRHSFVFSARGLILDRLGTELAWNVPEEHIEYLKRAYTDKPGFSHLLGFLHYPKADDKGIYYRTEYEAPSGVESQYHELLSGEHGIRIIEIDALGKVVSGNVLKRPVDGGTLVLSVDARLQEKMYTTMQSVAKERGFAGGAAGVMDIETGEILALTSYPEFNSNILTEGVDAQSIQSYNADSRTPYLNRTISGLYAPGSIVKPIVAFGALAEGVITPEKTIYSSGSIKIPNPYLPGVFSVFNDWKAHGTLDMRRAIAVSSNVYFYEVGGGFERQKGLGIAKLEEYAKKFGFASKTGIDIPGEETGVYPNPDWKAKVFDGDPWRIGDTYFTAIGQYGVQITPIQALKVAGLIANQGRLIAPHVMKNAPSGMFPETVLDFPSEYFTVVQEGMRQAVVEGTAAGLAIPGYRISAKTGTAEIGAKKLLVNSWVIGFFPSEKPKYAFAMVMERGPKGNIYGGVYAMRQVFEWMVAKAPEYFGKAPIASSTPVIATSTSVIDIDESPVRE